MTHNRLEPHLVAARLVNEAGGELIGRTRLQKVACLAKLAGLLDTFEFEYRHYGPFSERLATSMDIAAGLRIVEEQDKRATWGGSYSIYRETDRTPKGDNPMRRQFVTEAANISAILLELAATAAFLHIDEGLDGLEAWVETARRKPEKAQEGRLEAAKQAYAKLLLLPTPNALPALV
jgi:uncharacterized protein YwgA